MLNFSDKQKEYLRITSRFLKEVRLYDLWLKYCYSKGWALNWIETLDGELEVQDILGKTSFTTFVKKYRKINLDGYCIYEIFGEYLKKTNSEYSDKLYGKSINMLNIDIEGKKVTLCNGEL